MRYVRCALLVMLFVLVGTALPRSLSGQSVALLVGNEQSLQKMASDAERLGQTDAQERLKSAVAVSTKAQEAERHVLIGGFKVTKRQFAVLQAFRRSPKHAALCGDQRYLKGSEWISSTGTRQYVRAG